MRKFSVFIVAIALVAGVLAACSAKKQSTEADNQPALRYFNINQ